MIITHAHFQIDPTKEQEFLEEIRSLIEKSRVEEGNISYNLMKDIEKENTYTMVEVWEDQESVERHGNSSHFTAFVEKAPQFLTAPLQIESYEGQKLER
ncbi:antibiotic biosynthesis monooxygenase [Pontibacillus yanchengensis]|uniref:Antibiotic biosynthesis monooxygenase n=2 Tax=Pontibacillus yanchengensis TaxID=462910 RepID=A0ACC7VJ33_9BACI|nr:putative quinol monooxygenase [Pontibacillus yanchengensis]MYL34929.1 antibiotic biosynthesis monooxygenase [Pontibacillus yanchengensis]MYL54697.1 antibiotic biosynthesis monooxygenase [Pontibacillus yanchengensis]